MTTSRERRVVAFTRIDGYRVVAFEGKSPSKVLESATLLHHGGAIGPEAREQVRAQRDELVKEFRERWIPPEEGKDLPF